MKKKYILLLVLFCGHCAYAQSVADKEKSPLFVGLNAGVGGSFGRGFNVLKGSVGVDVATSINERFALGGYFSYQTVTSASLGLLFVHGNYNESHAFLWGIGYSTPEFILKDKKLGMDLEKSIKISPNLRLGFMLKNGLYFGADMEMSKNKFEREHGDCEHHSDVVTYERNSFDVNFRIGYKFNLTKKKN